MRFFIHLILIPLVIYVAARIAIKYDEYEKWNRYSIRIKTTKLVLDTVDAEWEYV